MKKLINLFIIIQFLIIIFSVPIIAIFSEDKVFSQEEYRSLITIETLKEEKYNSEILEKYFVDQFPNRSDFLKVYTTKEIFLNKVLIRDAYLIDKSLILMGESNLEKTNVNKLFSILEEEQKNIAILNFINQHFHQKRMLLENM